MVVRGCRELGRSWTFFKDAHNMVDFSSHVQFFFALSVKVIISKDALKSFAVVCAYCLADSKYFEDIWQTL
jgi:hypothetical protein